MTTDYSMLFKPVTIPFLAPETGMMLKDQHLDDTSTIPQQLGNWWAINFLKIAAHQVLKIVCAPVVFVVLLIIPSLASKESIPLKCDGILLIVFGTPDPSQLNIVI